MAHPTPVIGILGGMGPYAGLDLARKVFEQTTGIHADQDHLPVALLSYPAQIPDRSTYLFDPSQPSPAPPLTAIARGLEAAGATVAGMPCNTAHGPAIFDAVVEGLARGGSRLRLLHMIRETVSHLQQHAGRGACIGVLSTTAVWRLRLYRDALEAAGFRVVDPDAEHQERLVGATIFDPSWGIKAQSDPVTPRARASLLEAVGHLRRQGAEAVILGCTELPLAVPEPALDGLPMVDPTLVLARALIRETYPDRLRPWPA